MASVIADILVQRGKLLMCLATLLYIVGWSRICSAAYLGSLSDSYLTQIASWSLDASLWEWKFELGTLSEND